MHGQGTLQWADGKLYEGMFKNDKREGHGKFTWKDGRIYDGEWKDGKQNGEGIFINKENKQRRGIWESGKNIKWLDEGVTAIDATDATATCGDVAC